MHGLSPHPQEQPAQHRDERGGPQCEPDEHGDAGPVETAAHLGRPLQRIGRRRQRIERVRDALAQNDSRALDPPLRDACDRSVVGVTCLCDFLPAAGALHPLEVRNDG